ncbi:hypothetical protein EMCRGX_G026618 [Ephydatia muelleri]
MGAILGSSLVEMGAILGSCVPAPTRDPTSRADPEHWGVTTTNKYFQADQWRWVPFLDPTSRADPKHWGCDYNY